MKDKSGNRSLLSNGVARTHFMPPDGACILTVLKPLQSLTGGSRLDALQNRRLTNRRAINIPSARGYDKGGHSALSVFAHSYLRHFLHISFSELDFLSALTLQPQTGVIAR